MPFISDESIIVNSELANGELRTFTQTLHTNATAFMSNSAAGSNTSIPRVMVSMVGNRNTASSYDIQTGFTLATTEGLVFMHGGYRSGTSGLENDVIMVNNKTHAFPIKEMDDPTYNTGPDFMYQGQTNRRYGTITGPDPNVDGPQQSFGLALAAGCGLIVVGDPFVEHLNDSHGYGSTVSADEEGKVYIYTLGKKLVKTLTSPNVYGDQPDGWPSQFGTSVAIGNGRIVVGEPWWDTLEFYPGYGNNYPSRGGRVCIYDLKGNLINVMRPEGFQVESLNGIRARFGISVAVGCGRIAVMSEERTSNAKVWVYDLDGHFLHYIEEFDTTYVSNITFNKYIEYNTSGGSPHNYRSHNRIAISDGRIYVGDSRADKPSIATDPAVSSAGALYAFDLEGNWKWTRHISGTEGALGGSGPRSDLTIRSGEMFGDSVVAADGFVAVGAPGYYHDSASDWGDTGLVMCFNADGEYQWHDTNLITEDNANGSYAGKDQQFGVHLALSDGMLIVGGPYYNITQGIARAYQMPIQRHFLDIL